jgi:hypothetical protein
MRFRPSGGMGQRNERAATEARQDALAAEPATPSDEVFDARHEKEIERAENVAAGLPPDARPEEGPGEDRDRGFRRPHLDTPAEVREEADVPDGQEEALEGEPEEGFKPVPVPDKPQGLVESIRFAADKVIRRVQR